MIRTILCTLLLLMTGLSAQQGQGRRYADYAARSYSARYYLYGGDTINLAGKTTYNWAAVRSVWTDSAACGDMANSGWTPGGQYVMLGYEGMIMDTAYIECYFSLDNIPTAGAFLKGSVYVDSLILSYVNNEVVAGNGRTDTVALQEGDLTSGRYVWSTRKFVLGTHGENVFFNTNIITSGSYKLNRNYVYRIKYRWGTAAPGATVIIYKIKAVCRGGR